MKQPKYKNVMVIGASSGLGEALAKHYAARGCNVSVAARRTQPLEALAKDHGIRHWAQIDITADDAARRFRLLAERAGMPDLVIYSAGCGWYNPMLDPEKEVCTARTNAVGFTRIADAAFNLFAKAGKPGRIAAITSVAGTKGLGPAPAYSASKQYCSTYLTALAQLANIRHLPIKITDIRPGFIATDLLDDTHRYPMLMHKAYAVRRIARAIDRGRSVCTVDWRWRIAVALWRRLPLWLWRRLPLKLAGVR